MMAACRKTSPSPRSQEGEKHMAGNGKVQIQMIGFATIKLTSPEGKVLLVDPWLTGNDFFPDGNPAVPDAYKKDVGDMRESPALDVIKLLAEKGANLSFHDPHVRECNVEGTPYKNVDLSDEVLASADIVVILTDHGIIDYDRVVAHANRVFDTRNATAAVTVNREKITKL